MQTKEEIEFIDLGTSRGQGYKFIQSKFKLQRGVALDISKEKVDLAIQNGVPAILQDATDLSGFQDKSVKLTSMIHFLEHLPNLETIEKVISESVRVTKQTIYIRGPMFYESYLYPLGFRFYWSNWESHTFHVEPQHIIDIINKNDYKVRTYKVNYLKKVVDTSDRSIHPYKSLRDRGNYNENIDPPKQHGIKLENIYREFEIIIDL